MLDANQIYQNIQKSKTDLLRYARDHYGIPWKDTIRILKEAGYSEWDPTKWLEYTATLREHWPYLIELRSEEQKRIKMWQQEKDLLIKLANTIQFVEIEPGKWDYVGTRDAFRAKDALAALEREERIKETRKRFKV